MAMAIAEPASDSRKRKRYTPGPSESAARHIGFADPRQAPIVPRSQLDTGRHPLMASASARSRRRASPDKPRYDSAAAAAAAATGKVDGYKPREERSWEEFHPEFDIEAHIAVFSAVEVDGPLKNNHVQEHDQIGHAPFSLTEEAGPLTPRRRPGRPPRRGESMMLSGLGSPPAARIVPTPSHNPRERLNLPKPSYRRIETFAAYEADRTNQINYVDKTMAHVGFQESEMMLRPDHKLVRLMETQMTDEGDMGIVLEADKEQGVEAHPHSVSRVEYDMDEQDERWLEAHNTHRKEEQTEVIKPAIFEITMTQIEKEWHALERRIPKPNPKPPVTSRPRSSSAAAVNGEPAAPGEEQDTKCAICDDGDCENTNAIVFCDGCDLAVHQECYGVPFIPEGQWLCRKCQVISKSVPACVFCPNTEGAFKLTHEQRWAHLLCSIWIPEVTLGNPTFMEPIMDVAKVPKGRWKLACYICNQKMGACIQCGHKSCFLAFHVTCARRAKLFLRMKATHGGPFSLEASVLKALCDKHVPAEWGEAHDVPRATSLAKEHYRRTMKGRRWADSQASALAILPAVQSVPSIESPKKLVNGDSAAPAINATRKKTMQSQKHIWRLPSGAPVVPQVVFDIVAASLQRFAIRKRKEFVAEACKYWTLKREARRGAALLKRLQLQLESFSSSEITRRNFAAMGAVGGPRLRRRIDLADELLKQLIAVRQACQMIKERESLKLQDVHVLREVVDIVYFPLTPLLEAVLRKAQGLDPKGVFAEGFLRVGKRLQTRFYPSVDSFAQDLGHVFRSVAGLELIRDIQEAHSRLGDSVPRDENLTSEQKELKKLAKRIVKAAQQSLSDAFGKEAELAGEFNQAARPPGHVQDSHTAKANGNGVDNGTVDREVEQPKAAPFATVNGEAHEPDSSGHMAMDYSGSPPPAIANGLSHRMDLLTNNDGDLHFDNNLEGIRWYMKDFDPCGTEIHEERWTGRDVLRGMSEELSEMDDADIDELGPSSEIGSDQEDEEEAAKAHQKELAKRRKRYRTKKRTQGIAVAVAKIRDNGERDDEEAVKAYQKGMA